MSNQEGQELNIDLEALKKIFEQTKKIFEEEKQKQNNEDALNILIVGKTGAGKSTLINTVFGQEFAKAGSGTPVTQEIKAYTDGKGLTIYDTKGLELKSNDAEEKIERFLEENLKKEVKDQIHIAWLCVQESGRRVEEAEKDIMDKLKQQEIPTIVVITKAQQDADVNGEKFSEFVKKEFAVDDDLLQRVRAVEVEDGGEKKPIMGIKELIEKSIRLLPVGKANAMERTNATERVNAMKRKQIYDDIMRKKALKEEALGLIHKYAAGAGVIAATPIPFSDIALLLPEQSAMILHLNNLYGVEMDSEGITKTVSALVGVAGLGFTVRYAVGSALKFIPGLGTIAGGAFNATMAVTATEAMGRAYLKFLDENFENFLEGMSLSSLMPSDFSKYAD